MVWLELDATDLTLHLDYSRLGYVVWLEHIIKLNKTYKIIADWDMWSKIYKTKNKLKYLILIKSIINQINIH